MSDDELMMMVVEAMCGEFMVEEVNCMECAEDCMNEDADCPAECTACEPLGECLAGLAEGPQTEEEADEMKLRLAMRVCGDVSHDGMCLGCVEPCMGEDADCPEECDPCEEFGKCLHHLNERMEEMDDKILIKDGQGTRPGPQRPGF